MLFNHFANIVGRACEFYVGTLHYNFIHYEFWLYLNFLLEQQIKLVLKFGNHADSTSLKLKFKF